MTSIAGAEGNFTVTVLQQPRFVDMEKCIACGLCAEKCPKKVGDDYNEGLIKRKAIYVPYSQAVPLKYTIDAENCIFLKKGKCGACEKYCPSGAINFNDTEKTITLQVGSVILAPGFTAFDPARFDYYSYAGLPDVVTSLEFERILSATGPYSGHLVRPSSMHGKNPVGKTPQKIAWLQCVGSRDINRCDNGYCSSVCCMVAVKQAVMAKDHSDTPLDCAVFYIDIRTQGKDFDRYYENAKTNGVRFIPARIHTIDALPETEDLLLRYADEHGHPQEETFDMVVLSTGLEVSRDAIQLSNTLGVELDKYHFTRSDSFHPAATSRSGIYACGAFTGPKDIPQSVMEASAAACAATENLAVARNTQTKAVKIPAQRDVSREAPRIGVFVCNCGTNIGGIVRVPEVAEYAGTLPGVVYVEENLFTCSQDTQDKMTEVIRQQGLNRVVVAACTPRTHEALFQETLINAGLNKYLIEMANIRNQDSWVHSNDPDAATAKAKDLVYMAVAKSFLSLPLRETDLPVSRSALVVGAGVAGMTTALALARQGYPVHLVEKSEVFGGNARGLNKTYRDERIGSFLEDLIRQVESEPRISVHLRATISSVDGFVGNFKSVISNGSSQKTVDHGVAVIATGAKEYKPKEYLYGEHAAVVTHLEMDELFRNDDLRIKRAGDVVFIQCVGSRNKEHPYCSKVCCTHSIKSALELKNRNPETNVYILYRDIRTYGEREDLYREARSRGVLFFRYNPDEKPEVAADGKRVSVTFNDPILGRRLNVNADILCLAAAIVAHDDISLSRLFKVPVDADGWLMEAHQKLRPVEFSSEGLFLCGMGHYPKPIEESIAQAQAAAAKALTVLARENIMVGGIVVRIEPELCSGCLGCINV
ncbi:MAG: CoB--CoM heterodisulfide reductase iron-sulfur subunit A family protein, partial [Deltaproteobacteria bacterium]|nr:CoB--CoM heterodisulfide reductase iron-sulfur subunit A family protein [Deltaproteobacteria bacterium]